MISGEMIKSSKMSRPSEIQAAVKPRQEAAIRGRKAKRSELYTGFTGERRLNPFMPVFRVIHRKSRVSRKSRDSCNKVDISMSTI